MRYIPHSPEEHAALLRTVGVGHVDELFATVPKDIFLREPPDLPPPASEIEVRRTMGQMAARSANLSEWTSFLGAGLCAHHTPAFVPQLLLRGEFLTAYTPYQSGEVCTPTGMRCGAGCAISSSIAGDKCNHER